MKAWTYFYNNQVLEESDQALSGYKVPDGTYEYSRHDDSWHHIQMCRRWYVPLDEVPKPLRVWLLIL